MSYYDTVIHLLAGGLGGTAGAIATCPLEVVKTRLQSSVARFDYATLNSNSSRLQLCGVCNPNTTQTVPENNPFNSPVKPGQKRPSFGIWRCLKHIIETEGTRALFKGLGPNLVGVAPSRAIYFCTYSNTKSFFNGVFTPDTPLVHIFSAASADFTINIITYVTLSSSTLKYKGFMSCSLTNPIWFVKTRLQLDQRKYGSVTALQCVKEIYSAKGIAGFYKGLTASYFGISETIIHFVIYEFIKAKLKEYHDKQFYSPDFKTPKDFAEFMFAGAVSKTCASIIAYPHEVARTRLRQEGNKYRSFFQTLFLVYREEGQPGLYRGLATQLVRQIPNTAIMMATYEAVVYLLSSYQCGVPALQLCSNEEEKEQC